MPKRGKTDSDDDHADSDKPKHKKKMKKTTKGKKKPVKGKKKPRKTKIINSSIQTTAPPQPKPITHNQPMVSGHFDKNDAKDIEKIKENITKGAAVILDIQEEIKEEKRARGRPKGSKNKIIEKVEEKDVIIIPPTSSIKTRAQRKAKEPKTPTVAPLTIKSAIKPPKENKQRGRPPKVKQDLSYKFKEVIDPVKVESQVDAPLLFSDAPDKSNILFPDDDDEQLITNIKPIKEQLLENVKAKSKTVITKTAILNILKDDDVNKTTKLLSEYGITGLPDHLKKNKQKIAEYIYNIANKPDEPASITKFHTTPTNKGEEMFNEYFSEKLQKHEIDAENEIISKKKTKAPKKGKEVKFNDVDALIDPQNSLSNTGVNMGGGGSILENLLNIVAPYTPEHDPKTGASILG